MAATRIRLCADDYGIAPGVNAAIRDLIARSRLNATSVMVLPPSFSRGEADALAQVCAGGRAAIGLHVTLTAPFAPMTAGYRPAGGFRTVGTTLMAAMLRRLDPASLAAEIAAQFESFIAAFGRAPDFLDGHQHVQLFPQVREAFLTVAARRAPGAWVRQCGAPPRLSDPKGMLVDGLSRTFRARAAQAGIATNPAFAGTYSYKAGAEFSTIFPKFLRGLPDGGLIMCHPGTVDPELVRLDPLTTHREREYAYLRGDEFPATLAAYGVVLA
jgi:predicted glycoside hydrolase/deacetylase ChbG (UPF0249 family)